ncbi:sigma-70 family RNA polymerase sigma factor [Peristeroidobacter soli]|uniref:sigma-70 family RNA polymerase sigma factor n=1 Tax=Peristeroidobacter soli TaxID=2497877 RepID=UPI001C377C18|nr:sigma-70 family RNA polymerase sigma factor [Peristeroidobacter soli]
MPHEPALRAWLSRRRVINLEIDDIVQETYAVLASLPSVEHIHNPRTYAFSVAQSLILRHVRRARIVSIDSMAEIDRLSILGESASAERQVADREELGRITQAIAGLPQKCREAFLLRKLDGLSQRQVAEQMGVSENTIEKHIGKALRILMSAFAGGAPAARPEAAVEEKEGPAHGKVRDSR